MVIIGHSFGPQLSMAQSPGSWRSGASTLRMAMFRRQPLVTWSFWSTQPSKPVCYSPSRRRRRATKPRTRGRHFSRSSPSSLRRETVPIDFCSRSHAICRPCSRSTAAINLQDFPSLPISRARPPARQQVSLSRPSRSCSALQVRRGLERASVAQETK
jgi:hypothetical protein